MKSHWTFGALIGGIVVVALGGFALRGKQSTPTIPVADKPRAELIAGNVGLPEQNSMTCYVTSVPFDVFGVRVDAVIAEPPNAFLDYLLSIDKSMSDLRGIAEKSSPEHDFSFYGTRDEESAEATIMIYESGVVSVWAKATGQRVFVVTSEMEERLRLLKLWIQSLGDGARTP